MHDVIAGHLADPADTPKQVVARVEKWVRKSLARGRLIPPTMFFVTRNADGLELSGITATGAVDCDGGALLFEHALELVRSEDDELMAIIRLEPVPTLAEPQVQLSITLACVEEVRLIEPR